MDVRRSFPLYPPVVKTICSSVAVVVVATSVVVVVTAVVVVSSVMLDVKESFNE